MLMKTLLYAKMPAPWPQTFAKSIAFKLSFLNEESFLRLTVEM